MAKIVLLFKLLPHAKTTIWWQHWHFGLTRFTNNQFEKSKAWTEGNDWRQTENCVFGLLVGDGKCGCCMPIYKLTIFE